MRKGFTLVELLIVIAIIALLFTASLRVFSTAKAAGHSARCQGNLKALWQGVQNYASETDGGNIPYAGSYDYHRISHNRHECRNGWVCWMPSGSSSGNADYYPNPMEAGNWKIGSVRQQSGTTKTLTSLDWLRHPVVGGKNSRNNDEKAIGSIKLSYFFKYVNEDLSIYSCPTFRSVVTDARRSYVMNQWFGSRRNPLEQPRHLHMLGGMQASRIMLFTEMPITAGSATGDKNGSNPYNFDAGENQGEVWGAEHKSRALSQDGSFDCSRDDVKEVYGAIHRKSGRLYAHAIFLDGHIESLGAKDPDGNNPNYQKKTSEKISIGEW